MSKEKNYKAVSMISEFVAFLKEKSEGGLVAKETTIQLNDRMHHEVKTLVYNKEENTFFYDKQVVTVKEIVFLLVNALMNNFHVDIKLFENSKEVDFKVCRYYTSNRNYSKLYSFVSECM